MHSDRYLGESENSELRHNVPLPDYLEHFTGMEICCVLAGYSNLGGNKTGAANFSAN